MRRRPAIVIAAPAIVAIALIALGAWWLARGAPRDGAGRDVAQAPLSAPTQGAVPTVDATPARAPELAAASPAVAAAEQLARELGLELATGSADGPVLMAVEEGSGRPIAGVLLIVDDYRRRSGGGDPPARPPHRFDFLTRYASGSRELAYVTGDDGRVHVPELRANSFIVAYHPSFHGSTWLREPAVTELRVEMAPTKSVRVRVVDGAGHPRAKVPIVVTEPTAERDRISREFLSRDDGMVELHPFELVPPERGAFERVRVALALPLADGGFGVERLVDPKHLPDEPIELTLPPTGTLAIRVVDGAGLPLCDAGGDFEAGIVEAADAREPDRQIERTRRARGRLPMTNGECDFAPVGLGLSFTINVYSVGHAYAHRVVTGPRVDGERVEAVLPLVNESPTLAGRIVDPTGAACRKSWLMVESLAADASNVLFDRDHEGPCSTDAEGRFRVDRSVPNGARMLFRFTVVDYDGRWSHRGERMVETTPTGRLDLGDIVVAPVGVLVAGTIVERAGAPVEGARLAVAAHRRDERRKPATFENVPGLDSESGADGRFEIRGPPCDEELQLDVWAAFMRTSDAIPITSGLRDVRVVLERRRTVEIATRLDEGVPPSAVVVQLRANAHAPWRGDGSLRQDGTLTFEPGDGASLDLRFIACGLEREPVELAVVPDVALADDATRRDPRLDPVDLRGRLTVTRILLHDGDDNPVADAHATLWSEPSDAAKDAAFEAAEVRPRDEIPHPIKWRGSPASFESSGDGVLSLVAAHAGLPIEISAPGFLPQRIKTTAGERELVLVRSAYVRIEIEEAYYVSNLPYHLRAALIPDHADATAAAMPTRALQSGYALDAPVAGPGRYRVRITVARLLDDGRLLERDLTPTPATIDVGDPPTRLPIAVHVDAEALRKLDPENRSSH